MRRVERRVHFETERSSGWGAPAIQVAVPTGSCRPLRQTLRRVACPEESRSQTTVLGNQQWCLLQIQNVVWGRTQEGMFQSAPCKNLVPSLKRTCEGVEATDRPGLADIPRKAQRGSCTYSEKESGERYVTKDQRGVPTILETEVWKHTHTFILHSFHPTRMASEWYALGYDPRKSSHRRIAVTTNSLTKGRVEVEQLNCYCKPINRKNPFLTGPERGLQSDSWIWIYMSFKN